MRTPSPHPRRFASRRHRTFRSLRYNGSSLPGTMRTKSVRSQRLRPWDPARCRALRHHRFRPGTWSTTASFRLVQAAPRTHRTPRRRIAAAAHYGSGSLSKKSIPQYRHCRSNPPQDHNRNRRRCLPDKSNRATTHRRAKASRQMHRMIRPRSLALDSSEENSMRMYSLQCRYPSHPAQSERWFHRLLPQDKYRRPACSRPEPV